MLRAASRQWIGKRKRQEDSIGLLQAPDDSYVLVLSDGMGGVEGGDLASRLCVAAALSAGARLDQPLHGLMTAAVHDATEAIATYVDRHPGSRGMGATLVCAIVEGEMLSWLSIGDSHLYLRDKTGLHKLNQDHSMKPELARMVASGEITAEAAATDATRHHLVSVLSDQAPALIDLQVEQRRLDPGTAILLASDGLDVIPVARVAEILDPAVLARAEPGQIVDQLTAAVRAANHPRQDNLSLILAVSGPGGPALAAADQKRGGAASWTAALAGALVLAALLLALVQTVRLGQMDRMLAGVDSILTRTEDCAGLMAAHDDPRVQKIAEALLTAPPCTVPPGVPAPPDPAPADATDIEPPKETP